MGEGDDTPGPAVEMVGVVWVVWVVLHADTQHSESFSVLLS